jgi:hypothetical protein
MIYLPFVWEIMRSQLQPHDSGLADEVADQAVCRDRAS